MKGTQQQNSRQSSQSGEGSGKATGEKAKAGIGSSQGQDTPSREQPAGSERPSAGTADIERGSGGEGESGRGSKESLVQDPVGAYKERP